jgi:hypothetical protein
LFVIICSYNNIFHVQLFPYILISPFKSQAASCHQPEKANLCYFYSVDLLFSQSQASRSKSEIGIPITL